jgi:hypothetical protein
MPISQEEFDAKLKEVYPDFVATVMKESGCDVVKTLKQLSSILKKDFKVDSIEDGAKKIVYELKVAGVKLRAIEIFANVFIKHIIPQNVNLKHSTDEDLADRLARALSGNGTKPKEEKPNGKS